MKFWTRAATVTALTFCAGALANAATLDLNLIAQDATLQANNQQAPMLVPAPPATTPVTPGEIVQPLPQAGQDEDQDFASLSAAVAAHEEQAVTDDEINCLAVGVYYESKGEPLAGQLAVADVIINRTKSGRFPKSVCSVIKQPGQFSFVRGGKMPTPPSNAQWRKALAVAQVAQKDLWNSPAGNALYFHARQVKGFGRDRVAAVGNHIFYR